MTEEAGKRFLRALKKGWRRVVKELEADWNEGSATHRSPAGLVYGTDFIARTSVHESGHALASWSSCYATSLSSITVGEKGGLTKTKWTNSADPAGLRWEMAVMCLGGITAEMTVYGSFRSDECRSDLLHAREHAEHLHDLEKKSGRMRDSPWPSADVPQFDLARAYSSRLPARVRDILNASYVRGRSVMRDHEQRLAALARLALIKRSLDQAQIETVLGPRPWADLFTR